MLTDQSAMSYLSRLYGVSIRISVIAVGYRKLWAVTAGWEIIATGITRSSAIKNACNL